jgi:thiol-disulfide isomerase/thioredoxin
MNIFRILPILCLGAVTLSAQKISVKINGYTEGYSKLIGVYADANYFSDSAKINADGSMLFTKSGGYKEGLFYLMMPDETYIQFLVPDKSDIDISAKKDDYINTLQAAQSFDNQLFFDNQRKQLTIERRFNAASAEMKKYPQGSADFLKWQQEQKTVLTERDAVIEGLKKQYPNSFFTKFKLAGQNPKLRYAFRTDGSLDSVLTMYNYRCDYWNDFDFSDGRLVRTPVFQTKLKKYIQELTPQSADSIIKSADILIGRCAANKELFKVAVNWTTYNYKPTIGKLMDCESVFSHLVLKYFKVENDLDVSAEDVTSARNSATQMIPSLLGKTGQDIVAGDKNNVMRSIYGLKSLFKVVYIYNPDCEHCQAETPRLRQIYDQYKSRGLEIFSIASNAKDKKEWQDFANKYGINWTDVWDPELKSHYNEKYFIDITPELYLLDKNNKIIAKNLKPNQLYEVLENELAKMN